jgi:hypothetical protein
MTRVRVAVALGVVAVLAVAATTALAVATYLRDDDGAAAAPLRLTDAATGASLRLAAGDWSVREPDERISYGGAHVDGPAVLDEGYCRARPEDSFRALAGFTDQGFEAWVAGVSGEPPSGSTGTTGTTEDVVLADGTPATYRWIGLPGGTGPCAASGIEVAMVRAGDLRAVVVADSGGTGTLGHDRIRRVLTSLRIPR